MKSSFSFRQLVFSLLVCQGRIKKKPGAWGILFIAFLLILHYLNQKFYTIMFKTIPSIVLLVSAFSVSGLAQNSAMFNPDLPKLIREKQMHVFNREATVLTDKTYQNGIHLDARENDGVAWITGPEIDNCNLEFDLKGKNVVQQSFLGIAFHGLNDSTMDVIYFRPFNFEAKEVQRRNHSLQYVSLPEFDWQRLRTQFPDKYEQPLNPAPKPDEWFHVRVEIKSPVVSVYVNNNRTPALVVEKLNNRKTGMVGFWTGNGSDGDFANFRITE